jgi:hypothetical protein
MSPPGFGTCETSLYSAYFKNSNREDKHLTIKKSHKSTIGATMNGLYHKSSVQGTTSTQELNVTWSRQKAAVLYFHS